jgi:branched-chain amino acid transport system substrate-binding protein
MAIYRFDKTSGGWSRRDVFKAGIAAAAVAATGPYYLRYARAASGPIKIGFPVPLTGPYGTEAKDQATCAQIAVDEFNAAGGLKGRKVELLVRDSKLNPGEAAKRALELTESDKVDFLCGCLSASVQLAVNQVAAKHGVIYNSISQSDAINNASDFTKYTFHEALNPHLTSGAVGRYVFPKYGKKVAYLLADYAYGHEMLAGFKAVGEKFNVETVAEVRAPLGTTDFSTFFPRIQAAKPDVLICINFGRDQLNTIKQANDFGLKQQMQIAYPVILITERLAAGPGPFEGIIGGMNYYWGIEDKYASAKRLNDAYRKVRNGAVPSGYGAYAYAGIYGILEGVKKAGTTDADSVIAAMEAMKYDAYKGEEYFRKCDHQAVQSVFIVQSKPAAKVKSTYDVFEVVKTDPANVDNLRTCDEEGHQA